MNLNRIQKDKMVNFVHASTTVDGEFVVENYKTRKYNMFKNTTLIDR